MGTEIREFFDSLAALDRNGAVGPATGRAFYYIWLACEGRVKGHHRLFLPDLAARYQKSIRTAQYWIERLEAAEVLFVRNRTLKGRVPDSWVLLDVYHPNPKLRDRPHRADPQQQFSFMGGLQELPVTSAQELPVTSAQKLRNFRKRPCKDAVLEAVGTGQVSMVQALALIRDGEESPPQTGQKHATAPARAAISISKSKTNRNLDICQIAKGGVGGSVEEMTQAAFTQRIFREMGDPALHPAPVRKVAQKLAEGLLEWEVIQRSIDNARAKFREGKALAPWHYWTGAMRRMFFERGWNWRRKRTQGEGVRT